MIRRFAIVVALLALATTAFAQTAVPTPDEFLGYKLGDRFTPYDRTDLTKGGRLQALQPRSRSPMGNFLT